MHCIADRLQAIQRRNFYQLAAEISHRGRYYHEYTMSVDVTRDSPTWQRPTEDAEETVLEAIRDLARWLYPEGQSLAEHLRRSEFRGLIYPSVRAPAPGGSCLVCFEPHAIQNVRPGASWDLAWDGTPHYSVTAVG